jgi:hypothetical protein
MKVFVFYLLFLSKISCYSQDLGYVKDRILKKYFTDSIFDSLPIIKEEFQDKKKIVLKHDKYSKKRSNNANLSFLEQRALKRFISDRESDRMKKYLNYIEKRNRLKLPSVIKLSQKEAGGGRYIPIKSCRDIDDPEYNYDDFIDESDLPETSDTLELPFRQQTSNSCVLVKEKQSGFEEGCCIPDDDAACIYKKPEFYKRILPPHLMQKVRIGNKIKEYWKKFDLK